MPLPALADTSPLYLWPRGWLVMLPSLTNRPHQHVAASLLVGLDAPLTVTVDARTYQAVAAVVPPEANQSLHSDGPVAVMHLDPDEPAWRALAAHGPLSDTQQQWCREQLRALLDTEPQAALAAFVCALRALAKPLPLDPRIAAACQQLRSAQELPSIGVLAAQAGLSESRFRHLFREQMGVTFKRFLLHLKCQRLLALWQHNKSLTELAQDAGFYDQPHLNRTLRAMFDALPSRFIRGMPATIEYINTL